MISIYSEHSFVQFINTDFSKGQTEHSLFYFENSILKPTLMSLVQK